MMIMNQTTQSTDIQKVMMSGFSHRKKWRRRGGGGVVFPYSFLFGIQASQDRYVTADVSVKHCITLASGIEKKREVQQGGSSRDELLFLLVVY